MPPKPFSLDSILRFRKRQEELAQKNFIRKQLESDRAVRDLKQAESTFQALIAFLEEKQTLGVTIDELARFEERIQFERIQIEKFKKILTIKKKEVSQKRTVLLEKMKDYKTLDTLKDDQNKLWKKYIEKKEAAMIDEMAILGHDRNNN